MTSVCQRFGCKKQFDEATNGSMDCQYHDAKPVFHEGLKKWPCCNKSFIDFDDFQNCPGCKLGSHSSNKESTPPATPSISSVENHEITKKEGETEVYGNAQVSNNGVSPSIHNALQNPEHKEKVKKDYYIDEDPVDITIEPGTKCKRHCCSASYKDAESRKEKCRFHPGSPIFHEGARGWSCCKKRVMDYEELFNIKGCRDGLHLFVGTKTNEPAKIRKDFYQNPQNVIVSVYIKSADKDKSLVKFIDDQNLELDITTKDGQTYKSTWNLYSKINPESSSYEILSKKIELVLNKGKHL
ncbi:hypothetical protein H4219_001207 [Mycoemilia scoparia]|uniref:Cysteine and histidine-rich domain-containing protein 1 n=1 Tax=Mycoemilia scoparia TaxID=417184 RepID=A0A9W8A6L8_9FUNG|nr:hypothetical protein H4219_001207 [Mycoemilia scoparia]